jgi:HAD superfamily hydrolase (TIGR01549 family)
MENKTIKAIIFDLDGTLVHTKHKYIYGIMNSVMKQLGLEFNKEKALEFWFGCNRDDILLQWGIDMKKFWEIFRRYDSIEERKKNVEPYEDFEILKKLQEKNIKLGIVTGSPHHIADMELDLLNTDFDAVVFAHGEKRKPNTQALEECLNLLEVKKEEALFVGNGDEDILAAQALGIKEVHMDRGEHNIKSSPDKIITSLHELLEM